MSCGNNLATKWRHHEVLDIAIEEWKRARDFQLPLVLLKTLKASITNIDGEEIATGYDKVIADGGIMWIQIPRARLNLNKFDTRQRTASRSFYTFSGVTTHLQTQPEMSLSPEVVNHAVKLKGNSSSCRLEAGKYYVHAHRVKINTRASGNSRPLD